MKHGVAEEQRVQNVKVVRTYEHKTEDVAILKVSEQLKPVPGLAFLQPRMVQKVYRFGYSHIPCIKGPQDGNLKVQTGEVTNISVKSYLDQEMFLYSVVSRPGDSGGPLVSEEGYVVGITTSLTEGKYGHETDREIFQPHYTGIPSHVIKQAVDELEAGVCLPYETFE
ncbi:MAG: trypsin-like serine protease [Rhodobacteraceae bacterium]|nr:trypsin-like serine protease [Paracoccaceae bacterium]MYF45034.1 trypsin-like serine protease [Paracoccaceae bacterium]MYI90667.1 trypsin-like serine protease [Paracoccaceae bacterium]MYJ87592.1 trypsin-like serine protease [Paracoccaceae bacterium]